MTWGICTTAKAPPDVLAAFLGHHLAIGAAHIWVHLDDPDDPAFEVFSGRPNVTVIRCDARWWGRHRPDRHQNRQSRNMQRLYAQSPLPWIAHIDVDEFIHPLRPVAEVLAEADTPIVRMRPWEALTGPVPEFRAPVRHHPALQRAAFGRYAAALSNGALGHLVGKSFFRSGVPGLEPRLHVGFLDGKRINTVPFDDALMLLHFHANDRDEWLTRLPFRLLRGAYHNNQALLQVLSDPTQVAPFYDAVQNPCEWRRRILRAHGFLMEVDLELTRYAGLPP